VSSGARIPNSPPPNRAAGDGDRDAPRRIDTLSERATVAAARRTAKRDDSRAVQAVSDPPGHCLYDECQQARSSELRVSRRPYAAALRRVLMPCPRARGERFCSSGRCDRSRRGNRSWRISSSRLALRQSADRGDAIASASQSGPHGKPLTAQCQSRAIFTRAIERETSVAERQRAGARSPEPLRSP
jgi:hypothetical protein